MWNWLRSKLLLPVVNRVYGFFDIPFAINNDAREERHEMILQKLPRFEPPKADFTHYEDGMDGSDIATMDDSVGVQTLKNRFSSYIPDVILDYFAGKGFIGYQMCAIFMQHWFIEKACSMPGRDAVRNGYELSINDGTDVDPKVMDALVQSDKDYHIKQHIANYVKMGRAFGIRIAIYVVDSNDPKYYENPFNIDGIKPGTYRGIRQVDPYWCIPQFTLNNVSDPSDERFFKPTFWRIGDKLYHVSHLSIYVPYEVSDYLKPSYQYGGMSIPQRVYERVYASELTTNEAPKLAATKRMTTLNTDLYEAVMHPKKFMLSMQTWRDTQDNYGVKIGGKDDKVTQTDTALGDMDNLIMTQWQIACAVVEIPGTKMLGTQPKGFNSTGEYEEASYHETLESIQENDCTPLLNKHHQLVIVSDIIPKFNCKPFTVHPSWNELDAMTAVEQEELNLLIAQTGATLAGTGAIDGQDIRTKIANDPKSGYNGLKIVDPVFPPMQPGQPQVDPNTGAVLPGQPQAAPEPLIGAAAARADDAGDAPPPPPNKLAPPPRVKAPNLLGDLPKGA